MGPNNTNLRTRRRLLLAAALLTLPLVSMGPPDPVLVVDAATPNGWSGSAGTGFADYSGMLQPITRTKVRFSTSAFDGHSLNELTTLSYQTFVTSRTDSNVAPALNLLISSGQTLVYEPYLSGPTTVGSWQSWDALAGTWWVVGNPTDHLNWDNVLTQYGSSLIASTAIQSGFSILAGQASTGGLSNSWSNFSGRVDNVAIGFNGGPPTTYDFGGSPASEAAPVVPLPAAAVGGVALLGSLMATRRRKAGH